LGLRLAHYTEGSLAGLFASQTNVPLDSHLLVWDIFEMRGDLRPVGIFLIADWLWTQATYHSGVPRCLSIDEAASLLDYPEGAHFLETFSRRARKRYLRLVVMTQNPELFVQDKSGGVVASNAAIKCLKKQDRTSVAAVGERFGLTYGEKERLLAFSRPEPSISPMRTLTPRFPASRRPNAGRILPAFLNMNVTLAMCQIAQKHPACLLQ